jgi:hypothetical protein
MEFESTCLRLDIKIDRDIIKALIRAGVGQVRISVHEIKGNDGITDRDRVRLKPRRPLHDFTMVPYRPIFNDQLRITRHVQRFDWDPRPVEVIAVINPKQYHGRPHYPRNFEVVALPLEKLARVDERVIHDGKAVISRNEEFLLVFLEGPLVEVVVSLDEAEIIVEDEGFAFVRKKGEKSEENEWRIDHVILIKLE